MISAHLGSSSLGGRAVDSINLTVAANSVLDEYQPCWVLVHGYTIGGTGYSATYSDQDMVFSSRATRCVSGDISVQSSKGDDLWGLVGAERVTLRLSNVPEAGQTMGRFTLIEYQGGELRGSTFSVIRYEQTNSNWLCLLTGEVVEYELNQLEAVFTVATRMATLDTLVPLAVLQSGTFASAVTDSTQRPELDLGKALPIGLGHVRGQPLLYVREDNGGNIYDYLLGRCPMETTAANSGTTLSIERSADGRNWVAVSASEYTVIESTYVAGGVTYNAIRFITPQIGGSGFDTNTYYHLRATYRGITDSAGNPAYRSPYDHVVNLLALVGLSLDSGYSADAKSWCDNRALQFDGWLCGDQVRLSSVLDDIVGTACMSLRAADAWSSGWELLANRLGSVYVAASFGHGDGTYENIVSVDYYGRRALTETARSITLAYGYVDQLGYSFRKTRPVISAGSQEIVLETKFVWEDATADNVLCARQRGLYFGDRRLTITVGQEARALTLGTLVQVVVPSLGISGYWSVVGITSKLKEFTLNLRSWNNEENLYIPEY